MQRCPFYPPVINTHSFLIELVPGIINPETVSMLIHMEDARKVTQNTAPVCGEMPSFSMFSALPSVWSINLYLWQQFTLTENLQAVLPSSLQYINCNTVGRVCSIQSSHPVFFKVSSQRTIMFFTLSLKDCINEDFITLWHLTLFPESRMKRGGKRYNNNKTINANCCLSPYTAFSNRRVEGVFFFFGLIIFRFLTQAYFLITAIDHVVDK